MLNLLPDRFISGQIKVRGISELEDCSIGIDASYYCNIFLFRHPYHEPLLAALGGLTGIEHHIENDLNNFKERKITPFFVFDGQPQTGQEDVALRRGLDINAQTNEAWDLYFDGKASDAVGKFSSVANAWRPQALYPLLKRILRRRNLHFLVAPFNASAQLAHFDMTDSDQCAAIMGSYELLLYPISDNVIQWIDWKEGMVSYISKKNVFDAMRMASSGMPVNESLFIDALLMMGTNALSTCPPLLDKSMYKGEVTIMDALTMLRANEKSIAKAVASFIDLLPTGESDWLDKYQKARMAVQHFVYIADSGEIKINDPEHLTNDNHEYLGLQLPAEIFHYLNTGLISERIPSYITHGQVVLQPTLDGVDSPEYRALVAKHILPTLEMALSLVISRLHRGIVFKNLHLKTWYDPKALITINHRGVQPPTMAKAHSWTITGPKPSRSFGDHESGPISFEVISLLNPSFTPCTIVPPEIKLIKGIEDPDNIVSVVSWRWLHLRGYINDEHNLTRWGTALALALTEVMTSCSPEDAAKLNEPVLMAFELIRLGLFNDPHMHEELYGLPLNGSAEDKRHVLLLGRLTTLLRMRHMNHGYTGPLNKNLLAFRSLSSAVREANRDLVEAILLSMFLHAQCERDRDDQVDISQKLPFVETPDISMGIAVKTYLDDVSPTMEIDQRPAHMITFQQKYFPYATHLAEDLELCWKLFDTLCVGVNALDDEQMAAEDRSAWDAAAVYLGARR